MHPVTAVPLRRTSVQVLVLTLIATFLTVVSPASAPATPTAPGSARTGGAQNRIAAQAVTSVLTSTAGRSAQGKKQRLLVVRAYWGSPKPPSTSSTKTAFADADRWLGTVSRRRADLTTTVTPAYQVKAGCSGASKRGVEAARRHGYRLSRFDLVVVIASRCPNHGGEGHSDLDQRPNPDMLTLYTTKAPSVAVLMREYGYWLTLEESNTLYCRSGGRVVTVAAAKNCLELDADQDADVMGGGTAGGGYSAPALSWLGWLTASERRTLSHGSSSSTLRPLSSGGLRTIRIRASTNVTYWLEYRRRTGADAKISSHTEGVLIRRTLAREFGHPSYRPRPIVFDMNTEYDQLDALKPGMSWTAPEGVRIAVTSAGATGARVDLKFETSPAVPSAPKLTAVAGDGGITATWAVPADHGRPIQGYALQQLDSRGRVVFDPLVHTFGRRTMVLEATNGQTYTVRVRARNDLGWGPWASSRLTPKVLLPTIKIISPATNELEYAGRYLDLVLAAAPNPVSRSPITVSIRTGLHPEPPTTMTRRSDGTLAVRLDLARTGTTWFGLHAVATDRRGRSATAVMGVSTPPRFSAPQFIRPEEGTEWLSGTMDVTVKPGVDRFTGEPARLVRVFVSDHERIADASNGWTVTFSHEEALPTGATWSTAGIGAESESGTSTRSDMESWFSYVHLRVR